MIIITILAAWSAGAAMALAGGVLVPLAGGPDRLTGLRERARRFLRRYRYRGGRRASVGPTSMGGVHRAGSRQWGWV